MKTSRRTLLTAAALAAFTPRLSEAQPTQEKPMTTHTYHDAILHYRDNGKTDAPALLLLHGGLGTAADDFAPLLPRLHPHYRVIENDTRGHGQSTRGSAPLTYAQIAADATHPRLQRWRHRCLPPRPQ